MFYRHSSFLIDWSIFCRDFLVYDSHTHPIPQSPKSDQTALAAKRWQTIEIGDREADACRFQFLKCCYIGCLWTFPCWVKASWVDRNKIKTLDSPWSSHVRERQLILVSGWKIFLALPGSDRQFLCCPWQWTWNSAMHADDTRGAAVCYLLVLDVAAAAAAALCSWRCCW